MSRRRSLSTDISTDPRVAELAARGALPCLLYTWAIPHADDHGCLTGDPRQFRLLVCPGLDVTSDEVAAALEQIAQVGLWARTVVDGRAVLCFPLTAWYRHQSYIPAAKRRVAPPITEAERVAPPNAEDRRTSPQNPVSPSPAPAPALSLSPSLSPTDAVAVRADACARVEDGRAGPADGGGGANQAAHAAQDAQDAPDEHLEPVELGEREDARLAALGERMAQACGLRDYQPPALGRVLRRYHAHDPDELIAEAAKLGDWLARQRGHGGQPMEASVARLDSWLRRWTRQVAGEEARHDGGQHGDQLGDRFGNERRTERTARPARGRSGRTSGAPAVGSPEYYRRARQLSAAR